MIAEVAPRPASVESSGPDALTSLFESEYGHLCRLAYLLTGDASRAEEVVMDAFVRSMARWRDVREPEAYVRRAVVNLARNRNRRAFLERRHAVDDEHTSALPEPVDHVMRAVRALPTRQRAAIVLRYWSDLSDNEIADVLGCSVGTVKSQLSKARASLARTLGEDR